MWWRCSSYRSNSISHRQWAESADRTHRHGGDHTHSRAAHTQEKLSEHCRIPRRVLFSLVNTLIIPLGPHHFYSSKKWHNPIISYTLFHWSKTFFPLMHSAKKASILPFATFTTPVSQVAALELSPQRPWRRAYTEASHQNLHTPCHASYLLVSHLHIAVPATRVPACSCNLCILCTVKSLRTHLMPHAGIWYRRWMARILHSWPGFSPNAWCYAHLI